MALKDLFTKKEKEERPVNPTTLLGVRALAVGYLIYSLWQIIKMYMEGGEEAPSIWMLLLAIVVLGGGAVWIAIVTIKKVLELRAAERARLDAEDEELARQAALEEEASEEDAEDEEEPEEIGEESDDQETEEIQEEG